MSSNPKTRAFEHKGRNYEVRAAPLGAGWAVRVFSQGKRANDLVYTVSYETAADAQASGMGDLVEGLMETAENDVKRDLIQQLKDANKSS
jgi:hypothetical protein